MLDITSNVILQQLQHIDPLGHPNNRAHLFRDPSMDPSLLGAFPTIIPIRHLSGLTSFGEDVVALVLLGGGRRRPGGLRGGPLVEGVRLAQAGPGGGGLGGGGRPQEAVLLAAPDGVAAVEAAAADGAAPRAVPLPVLVGIARVADVAEPPEREEEGRFRVR